MIDWIKYDKNKPPTIGSSYLVSDGEIIYFGKSELNRNLVNFIPCWKNENNRMIFGITHYAEINLPTKE